MSQNNYLERNSSTLALPSTPPQQPQAAAMPRQPTLDASTAARQHALAQALRTPPPARRAAPADSEGVKPLARSVAALCDELDELTQEMGEAIDAITPPGDLPPGEPTTAPGHLDNSSFDSNGTSQAADANFDSNEPKEPST